MQLALLETKVGRGCRTSSHARVILIGLWLGQRTIPTERPSTHNRWRHIIVGEGIVQYCPRALLVIRSWRSKVRRQVTAIGEHQQGRGAESPARSRMSLAHPNDHREPCRDWRLPPSNVVRTVANSPAADNGNRGNKVHGGCHRASTSTTINVRPNKASRSAFSLSQDVACTPSG